MTGRGECEVRRGLIVEDWVGDGLKQENGYLGAK